MSTSTSYLTMSKNQLNHQAYKHHCCVYKTLMPTSPASAWHVAEAEHWWTVPPPFKPASTDIVDLAVNKSHWAIHHVQQNGIVGATEGR